LRKQFRSSADDVCFWCLCGEVDTSFGLKQACGVDYL
jgi:CO dehydrogenase/acetyl-CoA synthase alpha subunit